MLFPNDLTEQISACIVKLGDFQPEEGKYFERASYMEQVSFVNGMLDEVSKIINFFNIGYKKEGIVEFKGIEKNLEEFKKDEGKFIDSVYQKIQIYNKYLDDRARLYDEIEETRSEEKLIELDKVLREISELHKELNAERKVIEKRIMEDYNKLLTLKEILKTLTSVRFSKYYAYLEGYIREKKKDEFIKTISKYALVVFERPKRFGSKEIPPTYSSVPHFMRPFESIVGIYGTPSYWEVDPTFLFAITFPLFFALMFPDAGDGLVLLLFSILFYKYAKNKNNQQLKDISIVLAYSSALSMIIGMLLREFFGPLFVEGTKELVPQSNESTIGPLYYYWPVPPDVSKIFSSIIPFGQYSQPLYGIQNAIIIAILIGIILTLIANSLGIYNSHLKSAKEDILYNKIPNFIVYLSPTIIFIYGFYNPYKYFINTYNLLGALLYTVMHLYSPIFYGYYLVSFISIIIFFIGEIYGWISHIYINIREGLKNALLKGFIEGFFSPLLLVISNVISFIRLLVLGLSHYYILYAFSFIAVMLAGTLDTWRILSNPVSIIILILGNILVIGLEGFVAVIQAIRLNLYELGGKFCECEGRPFENVKEYAIIKNKC